MTRRSLLGIITSGTLSGCANAMQDHAKLRARAGDVVNELPAGTHSLGIRKKRDALLYVPESARAGLAAPLLLYLHGATGSEQQGIKRMSGYADQFGFVLLSPASDDYTWDAIQGGYGPDVRTIDQALTRTFAGRRIDPKRIAVCGFSDGASYALGLGVSNGPLFSAVIAFSPCFIPPGAQPDGRPRLFISHGTADNILPIDRCSHRLVPQLKNAGYEVNYQEFNGPHTVPKDISETALHWFLD